MIGIRVDANKKVATGHVMRCLSIASIMKNKGIDCLFITADKDTEQLIYANGFEAISLHSKWNLLDTEITKLVNIIREYRIEKLIIDSYYVTEQYFKQLMAYTKVIYIDDINICQYPISMLINYNIYYEKFSYPEIYSETNTKLLLGCDYAPLRSEFKSIPPLYREAVKKVLITTGGADNYNVAGKLLKKVIDENIFKDIEFYVVVGAFNTHIDYLERLIDSYKYIKIYQDVKKISKLMIDCDIAITAGGSTMYEVCACGIPSICFSFADNQLYAVKEFEGKGIMSYAGDIRYPEENCIHNMIKYINEYITNFQDKKRIAIDISRKIDAFGADRIADAIIKL